MIFKYFCPFLRAKLTGWLASKGKTLKRPAMTRAAPSKVSAKPKPDPTPLPQPAEQYNPQPCLKAHEPDMASAAQCANTQRTEITTHSPSTAIMNTTLDLLENSDTDLLVEPQDNVDNVRKPGSACWMSNITLHYVLIFV